MALKMTKHKFGGRDVLGAQIGDVFEIADNDPETPGEGLYRIFAEEDCTVRFGVDVTTAVGGEPWPAGQLETRYMANGESVVTAVGL
jgi:hypothetical protein